MQIELGLIGAIALMGIAVQLRILSTLQVKLKEIQEEQRKRERQADLEKAARTEGCSPVSFALEVICGFREEFRQVFCRRRRADLRISRRS